jgi:hypothetical protein
MLRSKVKLNQRVINPARYVLDTVRWAINGSPQQRVRVVLVSDDEVYTSEEQFAPFSIYRSELRQLGVISVHLLLQDVLCTPKFALSSFDIIIVKMSFREHELRAVRAIQTIRRAAPGKRIIYFDGDDDLCVQWPSILPFVDSYVKKHLFRDRSQYSRIFVGKSNLTDFVHREYGYSFSSDQITTQSSAIPDEMHGKLWLGSNLALDRKIVALYNKHRLRLEWESRQNDVIFRGSVPKDWIFYLRKDIGPALKRLGRLYEVLTPEGRVSSETYYREMLSSKICVSPYGYGEICWRDFEAVLCGCLLIKPNMAHVETWPDIFKENETYVSVRWDYRDLDEKCVYYLTHNNERERIVNAAFDALDKFYKNKCFIDWSANLCQPTERLALGIPKSAAP